MSTNKNLRKELRREALAFLWKLIIIAFNATASILLELPTVPILGGAWDFTSDTKTTTNSIIWGKVAMAGIDVEFGLGLGVWDHT